MELNASQLGLMKMERKPIPGPIRIERMSNTTMLVTYGDLKNFVAMETTNTPRLPRIPNAMTTTETMRLIMSILADSLGANLEPNPKA